MFMDGFNFRGSPCDNPCNSTVKIPEDKFDTRNNDSVLVEYNRTFFFPITRWLQMNRGKKITHKKLDEFKRVSMEAHGKWVVSSYYRENVWECLMHPVHNTILHLWDLEGKLQPWLAKRICKVLVGSTRPDSLPKADISAYDREKEYRGGISSIEMSLANISSKVMGVKGNEYDNSEIKEALESKQGQIDYEHNLDKYLNPI